MSAGSLCKAAALMTGALARSTSAKPQRRADVDAQAPKTRPRLAGPLSFSSDCSCIKGNARGQLVGYRWLTCKAKAGRHGMDLQTAQSWPCSLLVWLRSAVSPLLVAPSILWAFLSVRACLCCCLELHLTVHFLGPPALSAPGLNQTYP